jgi:hypothetical protein
MQMSAPNITHGLKLIGGGLGMIPGIAVIILISILAGALIQKTRQQQRLDQQ